MAKTEKRAVEFTLPYLGKKSAFTKRFGLNAYWSGKDKHIRAADAREIHELVSTSLYNQRIPKKCFERPVRITFYWHDGMDIDNHAALGKMIVDALKGCLLHDDNQRWFKTVAHEFHDEDCILIRLEEI